MKHDPDVASLLACWRDAPAGDDDLRARIGATVAALKNLRRDRPDLFPPEAARMVRPAGGTPAARPSVPTPAPSPSMGASVVPGAAPPARPDAVPRRPADAAAVLREVFGFPTFRPGQRELVEAVLAGRDALGVLPTGSGKSLTYQLPARILG